MREETNPALATVLRFLLGEGPLCGVHFGERAPGAIGNFWWRKHLRSAMVAAPSLTPPASQEVPGVEVAILPVKPTQAMLRPFWQCPPEELEIAYAAMLQVAKTATNKAAGGGK